MAFPSTYNFNYYKGDTYQFVIRPKSANGQAFDLTNYTSGNAAFTISSARGASGNDLSNVTSIAIDATAGTVTCTILPNKSTLTAGTWVYDVQIKDTSGAFVYTLVTGTITVTDEVTGA